MNYTRFLIGISAAALTAAMAAAPAASQTSTNSSSGNCTAATPTSPGGTCVIDNNAAGNDRNSAVVFQTGEGNFARIVQRGDDNRGVVLQTGEGNSSTIRQTGNSHSAENEQTGTANVSQILQADDRNSATVRQTGQRNNSSVEQGTGTATDAGSGNLLSVSQNGTDLESRVIQSRVEVSIDFLPSAGPADDNSATVTQTGTGSLSSLSQTSRGSVARVSLGQGGTAASRAKNDSSVIQVNQFYTVDSMTGALVARGRASASSADPGPSPTNNPRADNLADVAVFGIQNDSVLLQNGVLNRAEVSMLGGGSHNFGEPQANPDDPVAGPSGQPLPANAKRGNSSAIRQMGRGNRAAVSLGGSGGRGNRSRIFQGGLSLDFDNYTEADLGRDHTAFVWQRGILDTSDVRQDNNKRGFNGAVQAGSFADVSQRSLNSTVYLEQLGTNSATISQGTGTGSGDNSLRLRQNDAGDVTPPTVAPEPGVVLPARNMAAVSQTGIGNGITIDQNARNAAAIVWQQNGSRANSVEIEQGTGAQMAAENNAHDGAAVGSQGGYLAGTVAADEIATRFGSLNLTADVTQSGRGSSARVRQDGEDLSLVATQTGTAIDASGAAANSNNVLLVSQVNFLNSATVRQNGFGLRAEVDQRGFGGPRINLVTIQQTGDGHRALARQLRDVGTSTGDAPAAGDPNDPAFVFARPGGRQSAEIAIIQTGSAGAAAATANGNDAFVEQQGHGQFARIVQNGRNNDAGILQQSGATNAVAVIEQNGNGNRFFITQDQPGQYIHIRQNGDNNASTTQLSSAPNSGSPGIGSPANPGFFPF